LAADPEEQHNVASAHPAVVAELDSLLMSWLAERLAGRPDPMLEVVECGLPAVARLQGVIAEEGEQDAQAVIELDEPEASAVAVPVDYGVLARE